MAANSNNDGVTAPRPHHGRKAVITREDILGAAQKLLGPHRSISSLSLREVTREAGIAPNSFYRHFHDMDELAVALIDKAGISVRKIIGKARTLAGSGESVVVSSVHAFMDQLNSDQKFLHILLREGTVGSEAFKKAVERELHYFEEELCRDLVKFARAGNKRIYQPEIAAKAITRLVFALGGTALDMPKSEQGPIVDQMIDIVRMILVGAQYMAIPAQSRLAELDSAEGEPWV